MKNTQAKRLREDWKSSNKSWDPADYQTVDRYKRGQKASEPAAVPWGVNSSQKPSSIWADEKLEKTPFPISPKLLSIYHFNRGIFSPKKGWKSSIFGGCSCDNANERHEPFLNIVGMRGLLNGGGDYFISPVFFSNPNFLSSFRLFKVFFPFGKPIKSPISL